MIGELSAAYESSGDPGTVSTGEGDLGGVSFGAYQFSWNFGVAQRFAGMVASEYPELAANTDDIDAFIAAWRMYADNDSEGFFKAQHDYVMGEYYIPAITALAENGYHIEVHNEVMQDVVWSRAVQYGVGYIVEMFLAAAEALGYPNLSYVDAPQFDADMIRAIYLSVCHTPEWTNGSPAVRPGLYARFESECDDALARLA